ncbi:MAG: tetratricopeptide repeat protein, partial [Anaerolineales bacterium]
MFTRLTLLTLLAALTLSACSTLTNLPGNPASPTPTETVTPGPSATPTPIPTLTPTPAPTPIPLARVESGDRALFNGDFARAREAYRAALNTVSDPQVRAAALWGIARVEYEDGNYSLTLDTLRALLRDYPDSNHTPYAHLLLGETFAALARYQEAADSYQRYLDARPGILDAYVHTRRGDMFTALGDPQSAIYAYEAALAADRLGNGLDIQTKLGRAYATLGAGPKALEIYTQIFEAADNDFTRAQMDLLSGQVYLQSGQADLAYGKFKHAVENYPRAYDSYSALVALVAAGIPVSDLDRGLVNYFAGQYGLALAALNRYIAAAPEGEDGTAHYYRALTLRALGETQQAVDAWTYFIKTYPGNRNWITAWSDKAFTQWAYQSNHSAAAATLLDFVAANPSATQAPAFMREAGRIYERARKLEDAAQIWERLAETYPASEQAVEALHLAGITRYRQGRYDVALANFQRSLLLGTKPFEQARAQLWIGKTYQALGRPDEARAAWQAGQAIDPAGYYSERQRDLLLGVAPFTVNTPLRLEYDLAAEREAAMVWMRVTFGLPADTDLSSLGPLAGDARILRGREFWELGMYSEARLEFESVREAVKDDPVNSFRLADFLIDLGAYRIGIFAARQVLTLAGLESGAEALGAPAYFNHIRFGLYYPDVVLPAAERYNLQPLFLYSVIRQESLFEGFVRSGAGARGLMQIIPSTGDAIAAQLGWP